MAVTFVDTNVLVYAFDAADHRSEVARARLEALWETRSGAVSTQVLQEFYVVATRKFDPPLARATARDVVDAYATWPTVQVDATIILAASKLEERHKLSFWDALILEAARVVGAATLLTEDLQQGARLGGVKIENPFA